MLVSIHILKTILTLTLRFAVKILRSALVWRVLLVTLWILTWPVPVEWAGVVVGVDGARRVSVYLAVHGQVAVAGHSDPLRGGDGVVVDRLRVRIGG